MPTFILKARTWIEECSLIQLSDRNKPECTVGFGWTLGIPVKKQTFGKASVYGLFEKGALFRQAENSCFILYLLVFCVYFMNVLDIYC